MDDGRVKNLQQDLLEAKEAKELHEKELEMALERVQKVMMMIVRMMMM